MTSHAPRVLLSWEPPPHYMPPFRISERQVTTCTVFDPSPNIFRCIDFEREDPPIDVWTPRGDYDLRQHLECQGVDPDFDAVFVWRGANGPNRAQLTGFRCPRFLLVGDSHHTEAPLRSLLAYAASERFDGVVVSFNRQHAHWFSGAGVPRVYWIPWLPFRDHERAWTDAREPSIAFAGQIASYHPYRASLLAAMRDANVPVRGGLCSRQAAMDLYATSAASFNASLNGDLNLRVLEVMSAGGCLLTDRLSPEAGLDLLFELGTQFLAYSSAEELIDKAKFLLARPSAALDIARAAHRVATPLRSARARASELLEWALDNRLRAERDPLRDERCRVAPTALADFDRRVDVYEAILETHRVTPIVRVLFADGAPAQSALDAIDLPRVESCALTCAHETRALADACGLASRVRFLEGETARGMLFDIVVGTREALGDYSGLTKIELS